jgi:hypothetical protein
MKSLFCLLLLFVMLLFYGCGTSQLMTNSLKIVSGKSKNEVISILGYPGNRHLKENNEAWQYCQTRILASDDFMVVWFYNGVVTGTTTYKNKFSGNCKDFYWTIHWGDAPDRTIETQ